MDKLRPLFTRLRQRITPIYSPQHTLASMDAYALWAASYPPHAHNEIMMLEEAAMLKLMPTLAGRTVLDLACGTGRYSLIAREAGATRVIGTDNSAPMLQAGLAATPDQCFAQASMIALPFATASFDVIVCGLATGHLPLPAMQAALAEMARILVVGGEVVISDFHAALYLRGGRRTFTAPDGTPYRVEHYPHTLQDYESAAAAAGLKFTGVEEPQADFRGGKISTILFIRFQPKTL